MSSVGIKKVEYVIVTFVCLIYRSSGRNGGAVFTRPVLDIFMRWTSPQLLERCCTVQPKADVSMCHHCGTFEHRFQLFQMDVGQVDWVMRILGADTRCIDVESGLELLTTQSFVMRFANTRSSDVACMLRA